MFDEFTSEVLKPLSDGVNRVKSHNAERALCGIGFVMLPKLVERKEYIAKCYKNNNISIITNRNEVINDCQVSRDVWQYIKFPATVKDKGTMVFWVNIPNENKPIIVSTINKRNELLEPRNENSFKWERSSEGGSVILEGLGNNGVMNIFIDGEDEYSGQMILRVLNSAVNGLLSVYVQGDVKLESDADFLIKLKKSIAIQLIDEENNIKQAKISYVLGEGFNYVDEFNNQIIINDKILIKNPQSSLGTILNKMLTMYISTTTIDGKPLSPASIKNATDLLTEVSKIFL